MQLRRFCSNRDDGSYIIDVKAPNTMTSWIIGAFSMSDEHGLGIAETFNVSPIVSLYHKQTMN